MITTNSVSPFKDFADSYIKRGWFIFPLKVSGKEPLTPNGFKDASNDPKIIQQWAQRYPNSNIGIATEASNLIVIDCDSSKGQTPPQPWNKPGIIDGVDVFVTAIEEAGFQFDFNTFTVFTPNNGWHFYLHDQGLPIKSGTNVNGLWRVDIRSKGGYIVAPGSQLINGTYDVETVGSVFPISNALRNLFAPKRVTTFTSYKQTVTRYSGGNSYASANIKRELQTLSLATIGSRNETLNRAAFNLGRLVSNHPELRAVALEGLKRISLNIGLSEAEAARTIASAFKAGLEAANGK